MIDGIRHSVDKRTCTAFVPEPPEPVFCTENERCRGCPYPAHPEYGVVTIPFPIPHDQYAHCMRTRDELIQTADEIDAMMTCDCELRLLGECLPREELVCLLEQDMQDCPMTHPQEREGESDREKSPISQNST